MTSPTCPCCGQRIPPKIEFTSRQQQDIWDFISKRKRVTTASIIEHVYRNDPDGGPLSAQTVIRTQVMRMNKQLQAVGYHIEGRPYSAIYSLLEMESRR